ncbi:7-cyano-7-deazaguanine synthase QueC [Methanococcus voltae]|uniref:7-cyano-7-deazaguanine synthase n=1 Tax=Methanococcus voltae (strain ATCC BAA-1334 / A3) TaxID=456320 RepID=D7DQJ4_METV3|nr:7-cyano-7-deazaguanine synthase QueC [Methanococcus voltae]MCS3901643.1 7-cyano-7-deazaguanine synthase [Methanococcus voltae]
MKAICVLSGGLDSTVASLIAKQKGYDITCLTFNYGQQALKNEISASKKIAEILGAEHKIIDLNFLSEMCELSECGLKTGDIPSISEENLDNRVVAEQTMKKVWVPARNLIMFSIASGLAEAICADYVYCGINEEEASTFPDNTMEFMDRFNKCNEYGTLNKVKLEAPLYKMNKDEIVKKGIELEQKLGLELLKYSYSCYHENPEFIHCGICESCMRRKRAFKLANTEDITTYKE